jgi:riboflavin kinase/FMN adenylyltransferase
MKTLQLARLDDPIDLPRHGVATLGVFDGVHLGHRALIGRTVERAREGGVPAIVLTFAAHPVVVLRGLPPRNITSLPHRLRLFAGLGVDACVVLPFDDEVRATSAEDFATTVFERGLGLGALVLGPDARIGRDREGDIAFLSRFLRERGIDVEIVAPLERDGERISSTRVRAAIADGDLDRAARMLGRPVALFGTVVRGLGRGRGLGFPTANLDLHHEIRPPLGVYAVRAKLAEGEVSGVLNIGIRPTFGPDGDLTVEAHFFAFEGDLYGRDVEIELLARLRGEMRFASKDELIAQIARDVEQAKQVLSVAPATNDLAGLDAGERSA